MKVFALVRLVGLGTRAVLALEVRREDIPYTGNVLVNLARVRRAALDVAEVHGLCRVVVLPGCSSARWSRRYAHVLHVQEHVVDVDVQVADVDAAGVVFVVFVTTAVCVFAATTVLTLFSDMILILFLVGFFVKFARS